MPRLIRSTPSYRKHKASGQAIVSLSGQDHYLGPWRSKASRVEYDRLIGEWLANGRRPLKANPADDVTIVELAAAYLDFATGYYRGPDGKPTRSIERVHTVVGILDRCYGETRAADFGPLALEAIQQRLVAEGKSRPYVNCLLDGIRRVFKWAVSKQLVSVVIYQALLTVPGLRKGRSDAREPAPIQPIADDVVDATLRYLPPVIAAMVRFQRLTGCRPGEVCIIRPGDVDRSRDVWEYRPHQHKTEHLGRERVIFIGPQAQAVLTPYLLRPVDAYCFSPAERMSKRNAELREKRKSPVQPSQADRSKRKPEIAPGQRYSVGSYGRAIVRASDRALGKCHGPITWQELKRLAASGELSPAAVVRRGIKKGWRLACSMAELFPDEPGAKPAEAAADGWHWMNTAHRWAPNQLRHTAATELRSKCGLEAAQVILGHSKADVTQIYAERDLIKAAKVMKEVG